MSENRPFVIAILEDSPPVRDHFIAIIEAAEGFTLGPVATTTAEAEAIPAQKPDLVPTDLGLPDGSGLAKIPKLKDAGILSLVITAF